MKETRRMAISFQNNPALLYILCSSICCHLCNCGNVYECVRSSSWYISVLIIRKSEKQVEVPSSKLVKSASGALLLSTLFILKYRSGHCGYQEIPAVFTVGHFPWELQGNFLNSLCLDQAVATSCRWEKNLLHASEVLYTPSISFSWLKHKDGFAYSRGVEVKL